MEIRRKSVISGIERVRNIPVDPEHLMQWERGYGSIQDIMPYLTDFDREFILAGITSDEWEEAFLDDPHAEPGKESILVDEL